MPRGIKYMFHWRKTLPSLKAAKARTAKTTNSFAMVGSTRDLFSIAPLFHSFIVFFFFGNTLIWEKKHLTFDVGQRRASFVLPIAIKAPFTLFATMPRTISRTPLCNQSPRRSQTCFFYYTAAATSLSSACGEFSGAFRRQG